MSETSEDIEFWHDRLQSGERIAWVGRPRWTFVPDRTALTFSIPATSAAVGILFGGTGLAERAYFWAIGKVFGQFDPQPLDIGGMDLQLRLAAIAVLLWCAGYVYAYCVISPRFTRYALTDRRALIHTIFPWPKLRTKRLTPGTEIDWDGKRDGTIFFDEMERNYGVKPKTAIGTRSTIKTVKVGFHRVTDAGMVHDLMQQVASGAPHSDQLQSA